MDLPTQHPNPPRAEPTEAEIAWVAGFYSGEGCTHAHRKQGPNGIRFYANLLVGNTDMESLLRCQAVIGGTIYGPRKQATDRKPMYQLKVQTRAEVDAGLRRIVPYLSGEKRDQARRVMERVAANPPVDPHRGWPKGKPRGRTRFGGEPCSRGHDGSETYEYTFRDGRQCQKCRACQREKDAERRSAA